MAKSVKKTAKKKTAAGSLEKYRKKRNFSATPEPAGKKSRSPAGKARVYVVQKHDASHLHYDFRIEIDGVLKSWAVPKGPSIDSADKRLAVETEDHPMDYADFEGTIPEGQYGGGTVMVWDIGRYYNLKLSADGSEVAMQKTYEEGRIEIWIEGKKLRGSFALIRTHIPGRQKQWLLFKMKDALAEPGVDILKTEPNSALTGKDLEQIAQE